MTSSAVSVQNILNFRLRFRYSLQILLKNESKVLKFSFVPSAHCKTIFASACRFATVLWRNSCGAHVSTIECKLVGKICQQINCYKLIDVGTSNTKIF